MNTQTKAILFTVILSILVISVVVYRYEFLLKQMKKQQTFGNVKGGTPTNREYSATEIVSLIKSSKEYLGDSVIIFDNGLMSSNNAKFQGTISAVIDSKDNMELVKSNMNSNNLPLQYNIYILAATYYRQQYAEEFKNQ